MKQRLIRACSIVCLLLVPLLVTAPASALSLAHPMSLLADTPKDQICNGIGLTSSSDGTCGDSGAQVNAVLATVINFLSFAIGIVAVVMIIVAGVRFVTSGGEAAKVAGAKNTLVYAIVGLVIVSLAQVIVHFVLANIKA